MPDASMETQLASRKRTHDSTHDLERGKTRGCKSMRCPALHRGNLTPRRTSTPLAVVNTRAKRSSTSSLQPVRRATAKGVD
eukprot:7490938-Alexandrium_andersonii.AAC.1